MKSGDWDYIAESFHEDVLSPLHEDRTGFLKQMVIKHGGPGRSVIDLGCGVGRWVPLLARHFGQVVAVDFSADCLKVAERVHGKLKNVTFGQKDIGSHKLGRGERTYDFAVLCNSLLDGEASHRRTSVANLSRLLKRDGAAVLVVPALESFLYTRSLEAKGKPSWAKRQSIETIEGKVSNQPFLQFAQTGSVKIDDVPTKYFLRGEIMDLIASAGLVTRKIVKIEYSWKVVSHAPAVKKASCQPWDWGLLVTHA